MNNLLVDEMYTENPSDADFKNHFERLLNPPGGRDDLRTQVPDTLPYIPALDDDFSPVEVQEAIDSLKTDRSGGPSGVPPGVFKVLPVVWITFLATIFTFVFRCAATPCSWAYARLVVLFKKGRRTDCGNYRGLSVMDSFAKLYDCLLCRRLERWFRPDKEQAGAQRGRGCQEHLLTLRLLFDYVIGKKKKLFVIYVDYRKAYDLTPRAALITALASLGCGYAMTMAVATLYAETYMILGSAIITASIGLRQGSPSSCFLFTLYLNPFVRRLKQVCGYDGFLKWLHTLLLMDDTIILATSRQLALHKLSVLRDFCVSSGMVINSDKTKFIVINGSVQDRSPLSLNDLLVENCSKYTYLGCVFTQDGSTDSSVKEQLKSKASQMTKFSAFVNKNADAPFYIKRKVFDAAVMSSLMYGCETWLGKSARFGEKLYMSALKVLLGVRTTTPNITCLIETGLTTLESRVKETQKRFVSKLLAARSGHTDDPFILVWTLCKEGKSNGYKYLSSLIDGESPVSADHRKREIKIRHEVDRTKTITYRQLNPALTVPAFYDANANIPEYLRVTLSRFRLSSHNLAVETGRWSRIPHDSRFCVCGGAVQSEDHVLCKCPKTASTRSDFPSLTYTNATTVLNHRDVNLVGRFVYTTLKILNCI